MPFYSRQHHNSTGQESAGLMKRLHSFCKTLSKSVEDEESVIIAHRLEASLRGLLRLQDCAPKDQDDLIDVLRNCESLISRLIIRQDSSNECAARNARRTDCGTYDDHLQNADEATITHNGFEQTCLGSIQASCSPAKDETCDMNDLRGETKATASDISSMVNEIISLRDWMMLAKPDDIENARNMMVGFDMKLRQILADNGVEPIEESGCYDFTRQMVMQTAITSDESLNETICETIRPGYILNGNVIRPQEVVVYVYKAQS